MQYPGSFLQPKPVYVNKDHTEQKHYGCTCRATHNNTYPQIG